MKPFLTSGLRWRKLFFELHGWLGLNLGLLLFVVCLSGTFATLSDEIDAWIDPTHRITDAPDEGTAYDWTAMVAGLEAAFPDGDVQTIYAPGASGRPMGSNRTAALALVGTPVGETRKVHVDPYTGAVLGHTSFFNVERFFRSFHRRFFDGTRGILLVTLTGFALLASAITGFTFYKGWWRQMRTMRLDGSSRRRWSDLHKVAGIWGLPFTALIAVTGIYYFVEVVYQQAGEYGQLLPMPMAQVDGTGLVTFGSQPELMPANRYVEIAVTAHPGLVPRTLRISRTAGAAVYVDGQAGNLLTRDRADAVHIHPFTGEVLDIRRTSDLDFAPFMTDAVDPIHFGYFGGLWTQLLWFVLGLLLSFSILSGMYIWVVRSTTAVKKPTLLQRGAPVSAAITLLYLGIVGFATVDGIRVYAVPAPESATIDRVSLGPYDVRVDCVSRCGSESPTIMARFEGAGLPNYRRADVVDRGGSVHRLFGASRRPTGVARVGVEEIVAVRVTTLDGTVYQSQLDGSIPRAAPPTVPNWPDTAPGVWWVVIGFSVLTVGSILGWLGMVMKVARAA